MGAWSRPLLPTRPPGCENTAALTERGQVFFIGGKSGKVSSMMYRCPMPGCGGINIIHFSNVQDPSDELEYVEDGYIWNGSEDKPSVDEVIDQNCGWRGYLREGFWCESEE